MVPTEVHREVWEGFYIGVPFLQANLMLAFWILLGPPPARVAGSLGLWHKCSIGGCGCGDHEVVCTQAWADAIQQLLSYHACSWFTTLPASIPVDVWSTAQR